MTIANAELAEALTAAGVPALNPKIIDPVLLEYQRRYAPVLRAIPSIKWDADSYYFNSRTNNPVGGFVVDGGARPLTQSTYVQNSFQMKHVQTIGAVTGYAQAVTRAVITDLRGREIEGSIAGQMWDIEHAMMWGNAGATAFGGYPQFDGLDTLVSTYTGTDRNALNFAGAALSLAMLDEIADMVEVNSAMDVFHDAWMFVMSPTAVSKVAQLIQNQQRFVDQTEVAAGLLVPTYRGIPLVKSSFLSSRGLQMSAVTTATATTGGTLAAATYSYMVTAVIQRQGEIAASAEVSQVTTGATSTATLTFTPPTGQDGLQATLYKVYRSTSAGTETLLGIVDGTVGVGADGVTPILTTKIVDTGATLIPMNGATAPATYPATYQGTNTSKGPAALSNTNGNTEPIYLLSRDEANVCRPYVRDLQPVDVYPTVSSPDSLPYALVSDTCLAVRAPKFIGGGFGIGTRV